MALSPGIRLGRYEIIAFIGAGGMGEVYSARDARLRRTVAIKLLSNETARPEARRRFLREAQIASALNHPNLVTVYDVAEWEGRYYIVTELVDGGTLRDWSTERRRHPFEIAALLSQVADGLAAAHEGRDSAS